MCGNTKKSQPVAPISASRKMNVTLDANSASLNKRNGCTLCDKRRTKNVNLFVLNVSNMYVLNTLTLSASTVLSYYYYYCYYFHFRLCLFACVFKVLLLFLFICKWFDGLCKKIFM